MLKSIRPFSNGYRRLFPNLSLLFGQSHWTFLSSKWFDSHAMAPGGLNQDWMTASPGYSELPKRPKYQAVWERYRSFLLPYGVCLFSVPCPGWCVKHVFRLIGCHVRLDPQPCAGSTNPILWVCPVWASPSAVHSNAPQATHSSRDARAPYLNLVVFWLQNCWTHFMFGKWSFFTGWLYVDVRWDPWVINISFTPQNGGQL